MTDYYEVKLGLEYFLVKNVFYELEYLEWVIK